MNILKKFKINEFRVYFFTCLLHSFINDQELIKIHLIFIRNHAIVIPMNFLVLIIVRIRLGNLITAFEGVINTIITTIKATGIIVKKGIVIMAKVAIIHRQAISN